MQHLFSKNSSLDSVRETHLKEVIDGLAKIGNCEALQSIESLRDAGVPYSDVKDVSREDGRSQ